MIELDLKEYDYNLPAERIAQYPLTERDGSRLLVYRNKKISENIFRNIDHYIPSGSLMVFNNTKVIRARLIFKKESGANIEVFCVEPLSPGDYAQSFSKKDGVEWKCLIGNIKKWKKGIISTDFSINNMRYVLFAEKLNREGDAWRIRFSWNANDFAFSDVIEATGHVPLPPYLNRPDEAEDSERYQTIYSQVKGSVAAPTAGLHFTNEVFNKLLTNEIQTTHLILHVGAGTFQPVKSDSILDHQMHSEHFYITINTIESVLKKIGSILAVGTTSVRTLESLYWLGLKLNNEPTISPEELFLGQWESYSMKNILHPGQSLEIILSWMQRNKLKSLHAPTKIIIVPGYDFKIISGMLTNFHQPKSTLLLLISAWVGDDWKKIYRCALENDFRFLSYGDSSLLLK
jgi:S-adenosylmethionine:tRNA ribosyltransferase-isomerase